MSISKHRISALQAVVAGTVVATNPTALNIIQQEFVEVVNVNRMRSHSRRRLLQVLHSTRALDSFLSCFTDHYHIRRMKSLGGYLNSLENHSSPLLAKLASGRALYYQRTIVNRRNKYMHEAGTFPHNDADILSLIAEMQTCLAEVARL